MRPDIAHFASPESAVLLWAYKLAGCRIVVRYGADCHASMSTGPQRWAKRWVQFQLRWADSIIAVTPALAKKLRTSAKGGSIHVIGNALDRTDNFPCVRSAPVSGDYILFVGPIKKSIHRLISAFRVFARSHPNMQLVIVGQWSRRADRRKIAALDDERIVMLGNIPRPQLVPLYRGARFFVNPSTREGHTESLLEAISFGCPILLSDLPENRDLRLNAKYYFDPGNLRSIISAFNRAHAHPDGFRVAVDRFPHWEDIADQMIQVYEQLFADEPAVRTGQRAPSRI